LWGIGRIAVGKTEAFDIDITLHAIRKHAGIQATDIRAHAVADEPYGCVPAVDIEYRIEIREVVREPVAPPDMPGTAESAPIRSHDMPVSLQLIDDELKGRDGNDQLFGNDGQDRLEGGHGNDVAWGGAGDDRLRGDDGDDKMYGGAGDDRLRGGKGADRLEGGDGNDEIRGGDGNDLILGGAGNDTLEGGKGADAFVFTAGEGGDQDLIKGFETGKDVIVLLDFGASLDSFGDLDTNGNGVLDDGDALVSISSGDSYLDLSAEFGSSPGTHVLRIDSDTLQESAFEFDWLI